MSASAPNRTWYLRPLLGENDEMGEEISPERYMDDIRTRVDLLLHLLLENKQRDYDYREYGSPLTFSPEKAAFLIALRKISPPMRKEALAFFKDAITTAGTHLLNELSRINPSILEEIRIKTSERETLRRETAANVLRDPFLQQSYDELHRMREELERLNRTRRFAGDRIKELEQKMQEVWNGINTRVAPINYILPLSFMAAQKIKDLSNFVSRIIWSFSSMAEETRDSSDIRAFFRYARELFTPVGKINEYLNALVDNELVTSADTLIYFPVYLEELQNVLLKGGVKIEGSTEGNTLCIHCGIYQ